jgi:cytochrome c-type biogenesis protein CcmH/NrfG
VLLDRRKVKFWQKIVFGFMAFLMAAFLVVGYSGVLNGCTFFSEEESVSDTLNQEIAAAKTATTTTPDDPAVWVTLAEAYETRAGTRPEGSDLMTGDFTSALTAYRKAESLLAEQKGPGVKAQRLEILNQMATLSAELNDSAAYIEALQDITGLTPKDPQAFLNLGLAARNVGDTTTALLALSRFLELDPTSPDAEDVKTIIAELAPQATPSPSPTT